MSLDEVQFKNLGIRAGRLRGIEVWVHWMLILVVALQLLNNYIGKATVRFPFQSWLASVGALFLSVLLHELGHCYAAFRVGGGAERIILWPLGGLAICDAPHEPRSQFWVAACGPMVNAALAVASGAACIALGWDLLPYGQVTEDFRFLETTCQFMVLWNVFLLVLNLLPCYPLDGGRMLQALLWSKLESFGHASFITLRVSQVSAVLALVAGLLVLCASWIRPEYRLAHPLLAELGMGAVFLALLHFAEGRALQQRLAHGEEEEGIFGYDFSRGYTSLERTATRQGKRVSLLGSLRERFRERARALEKERERETKQRVDHLLEKIHREGMGSLTRAERRYLTRASRRLQK